MNIFFNAEHNIQNFYCETMLTMIRVRERACVSFSIKKRYKQTSYVFKEARQHLELLI